MPTSPWILTLALLTAPALAQDKASVVWQDDPVCQFVFFAVLEGLYEDGVQDEVVDLVIGTADDDEADVDRCFVFQCELCHAVFEAFVLYRQRQVFQNATGKTTFGPGVDPAILEPLGGESVPGRVYAMGSMIRPWIERRIDRHRLSREEQVALHDRIAEYAAEGRNLLAKHRQDPKSVYIEWNFYGTCQACEAAEDIARRLSDD